MFADKYIDIWRTFHLRLLDRLNLRRAERGGEAPRPAPLPQGDAPPTDVAGEPVPQPPAAAPPTDGLEADAPEPATTLSLQLCSLHDLERIIPPRARRLLDLPGEAVAMAPLESCRQTLATIEIAENTPHQPWTLDAFTSCAPAVFELDQVVVHGAVGIIAISTFVVSESLWHTATDRHRYAWRDSQCEITFDRSQALRGRHLSILAGAAESYWHAVFDTTARLGLIPPDLWKDIDGLLIPSTGVRQRELVELFGVPPHVDVRVVGENETFTVERLVVPSSMHVMFDYHPRLVNMTYDRMIQAAAPGATTRGRRIFIDRRGSGLRRLLNEEAVVDALVPLGFEAIPLENLSIAEQVRLFRDAEIIVAPHGAGLTNIGFARPGTIVVELMMDAYLNWCYRRIAAIRHLDYQCLIGRADLPVSHPIEVVHWRTWTIDVDMVRGFVETAIERRAASSAIT